VRGDGGESSGGGDADDARRGIGVADANRQTDSARGDAEIYVEKVVAEEESHVGFRTYRDGMFVIAVSRDIVTGYRAAVSLGAAATFVRRFGGGGGGVSRAAEAFAGDAVDRFGAIAKARQVAVATAKVDRHRDKAEAHRKR
jgi:hypothetical protein